MELFPIGPVPGPGLGCSPADVNQRHDLADDRIVGKQRTNDRSRAMRGTLLRPRPPVP